MHLVKVLLLASIAAISVTPRAAHAQNAEAEALFDEGDKLLKAGKLGEACDAFEASNRMEPRAGTLIRLGDCREQNHQLASAWSAYKDALTRVKDAKKRAIAQAKVTELEPKISYVTLSVSTAARIPGLEVARNGQLVDQVLWNRAIPINGGEYTFVARAPGRADWQQVVTVPAEKGKVAVEVPVLEPPKPKVTPVKKPDPIEVKPAKPLEQPEPVDRGPSSPSAFTGKRKVALVLGGVAVVGIGVGAFLGKRANALQDDAHGLCPNPSMPCADAMRANKLNDDARGKALVANVMFGVAGASVIGAAVLWFTGAPRADARVAIVPGASSLSIVGHF